MCDCVQHDLGPFHWISIYVSIQGRGGGYRYTAFGIIGVITFGCYSL